LREKLLFCAKCYPLFGFGTVYLKKYDDYYSRLSAISPRELRINNKWREKNFLQLLQWASLLSGAFSLYNHISERISCILPHPKTRGAMSFCASKRKIIPLNGGPHVIREELYGQDYGRHDAIMRFCSIETILTKVILFLFIS
jgi:hypothetical protein